MDWHHAMLSCSRADSAERSRGTEETLANYQPENEQGYNLMRSCGTLCMLALASEKAPSLPSLKFEYGISIVLRIKSKTKINLQIHKFTKNNIFFKILKN
jgi:hypothetical protein